MQLEKIILKTLFYQRLSLIFILSKNAMTNIFYIKEY